MQGDIAAAKFVGSADKPMVPPAARPSFSPTPLPALPNARRTLISEQVQQLLAEYEWVMQTAVSDAMDCRDKDPQRQLHPGEVRPRTKAREAAMRRFPSASRQVAVSDEGVAQAPSSTLKRATTVTPLQLKASSAEVGALLSA